jgi:hypothetical protein
MELFQGVKHLVFLYDKAAARRVALLMILAALLAVTLLTGCGGGGGGGGGSSSTTFNGIVLDSLNSDQGAGGATVTMGGKTTTTRTVSNANADNPVGSFVLTDVPTGTNAVTITPSGGAAQNLLLDQPVHSGANGSTAAPVQLFINIGQVSGRVLLPNGQPAASAFVTVSSTAETFQTNADGTFLATLVPQGSTQVFAVKGTASAQKNVTVEYGNNGIGDLQLVDDPNPNPPGAPYTLFGTVTVQGVGTPAGTTVILFRNGIQIESTVTNGDGIYAFYVPVGQYTVRALRNGFQDTNSGTINLTDPNAPVKTDLTMNSL